MKKYVYLLSLLLSISLSSQELYWYDVILEVEGEDLVEFEKAVDDFYSSVDFPEDVTMTFSAIPLKGQGFEETHILSFVSPSSQSLANLRSSLTGEKWENYLDIVRPFVDGVRASAGNAMMTFKPEEFHGIGQVWGFKILSKDIPAFASAFSKLMDTFDFPGFVGLAQVTHGISGGENILIYGTYEDLNSAFTFGPKSDAEAQAFEEFFNVTADISEFTQSWTRVKINDYN
tara:strand:+ start:399 stop:1091 length:693 start_codon:yes stop_codon:yes gene_type:complete